MRKIKLKNLFTMVELILVIAIIAFLTVTATVVLSQWLSKSRDSRRMADIAQIEKGIETAFIENNEYPLPDSYVNITSSGTVFNYQGKFCDTATEKSNIKATPKDPLDSACYTYETTTGQNKFQLMAFMENTDAKIGFNYNTILAVDYTKRIPSVKGDKLGILVASGTNQPIEDTGTGVDVVNTRNEFVSYFTNINTIAGTGKQLYLLGSKNESCNSILKTGGSKGNGIYNVKPSNYTGTSFEVYCDMTSDGGGWTLIINAVEYLTKEEWSNIQENYLGRTCNNLKESCRLNSNLIDKLRVNGETKSYYLNKRFFWTKVFSGEVLVGDFKWKTNINDNWTNESYRSFKSECDGGIYYGYGVYGPFSDNRPFEPYTLEGWAIHGFHITSLDCTHYGQYYPFTIFVR